MYFTNLVVGLTVAASVLAHAQAPPQPQSPQTSPGAQNPQNPQSPGIPHQDGDIGQDDIPPECRQTCASLLSLTQRCEQQNDQNNPNGDANDNNNDTIDNQNLRNCICNDQNAQQSFQSCGTCIAQYPNYFVGQNADGRNDNEVALWAQQCNFAIAGSGTVTGMPSGTTSCSTVQITTTVPVPGQAGITTITTQSVDCGYPGGVGGPGGIGPTPSSWSTSIYTSNGLTSTVLVGTEPDGSRITSTVGRPYPQQTGNAAIGMQAPLAYAGAGACFLVAAFAL